MTLRRTDCEGFHRRDVLRIGATGILGLSLPSILRLEARAKDLGKKDDAVVAKKKAHSVILVWLPGGPATIDMWDLKPDAPAEIKGEFKEIDTNVSGLKICEHLPKMAQVMDRVTLVRSLNHTIPSHGPATVFMTTGNKPTAALQYPALGSLCSKLLPVDAGIPPYVAFNDVRGGTAGQAGYLGTAFNPFMVEGAGGKGGKGGTMTVRGITLPQGFDLKDLEKREKLLESFDKGLQDLDKKADVVDGLDAFHKKALEILRSDKTKNAFDLAKESQALRDKYTATPFGTGLVAARRLIEAGVRFVSLSVGGWDTHGQNFKTLKDRNLPALDQPLATLLTDLDERGMLESTIVMVAGEFGRTPKINKNAGRDHWARSMACVLAGGGFKRGYVHGTTDPQGMAPATLPCTPDDISATMFQRLGVDPHLEMQTSTGRPVQLFREGKVVDKLVG
jgi:hypothetical protein